MGLEDVKNEILSEARKEAQKIREEAEREAEKIVEEAEKEADEVKESAEKELEEKKKSIERKEISNARMKAKEKQIKRKERMIDRVFREFEESLEELDEDRIEGFVEKAFSDTDFNVQKVKGSEKFLEAVEEEVEKEEIKEKGVILESEGGMMRKDYRIGKVVDDMRENLRKEVAGKLFGDVNG